MNDDGLTRYMTMGDPIADRVTLSLVTEFRSQWPKDGNLFRVIKRLSEEQGCQSVFREFVEHVDFVPTWVNFTAMNAGQNLFSRTSPFAIGVMVLGVLGRTYAPGNSADVLVATGRLKGGIVRRLYETADMVHKLIQPHGLKPGRPGHEAVVRVRLMHSLVRLRLTQQGRWPHKDETPISQLEMALVGVMFVFNLIDGLKKLGFALSKQEQDSYVHLWRYANYLQGIDDRLVPKTTEELRPFYDRYRRILWTPNGNSKLLMSQLLEGLDWLPPFHMSKGFLESLACFLMEPELVEGLGIRPKKWHLALLRIGVLANKVVGKRTILFPFLRRLEGRLGYRYFDKVLEKGLGGKPADYLA